MPEDWELLLRLVLSCILGGIIGYERQARRKSAGLRTNVLVCLGSCLIMVLSQSIYKGVEGYTNADPARLAAQVVSGIGFLGAGAIMKEGVTVTGLTTAACLWVVSGVGLAVGYGYYSGAIVTTMLVFLTIGTLSKLDHWIENERKLCLSIHSIDSAGQMVAIANCLEDLGMSVRDIHIKESGKTQDGEPTVIFKLEVYNRQGAKLLLINDAIKKIDGVINVDIFLREN